MPISLEIIICIFFFLHLRESSTSPWFMFCLSELRTIAKDASGNAQYGCFASLNIPEGTVIWKETEVRRAYYSPEYVANATEDQRRRLDRFGFSAEDKLGYIATFAWVGPWVLGEVSELPLENRPDNGDFFNHSCDPNCWWIDEYTLVARRDIYQGEELCYDYGTEDEEVSPFTCFCGAARCRKNIGGAEWRRKSLHQAYGKFFKPFLLEKITELIVQERSEGTPIAV